MRKLLTIVLILILCIVISGCTQQPVTPAIVGAQTSIPPTGSIPASLSNARPNATLALDTGVILVSFHTSGAENIAVNFVNVPGSYGAMNSLSTSGPFNGSLAFQVPQKDLYLLNISGTGAWTADVTALKPSTVLKAPVNLSGSGTVVTPFFYLDKGQYFFQRNKTGLASPQYYLWYANGSPLMDANNTFVQPRFSNDDPHPFCFIEIPVSGTYFTSAFSRNNPGNWSASISPVPPLPAMGPGPVIIQWTGTPAPT